MDTSFRCMYWGLSAFLSATKDRRDLLLNQRKPEFDTALNGAISAAADDFVRITLKAQAAKDYFLLVGPPGTGKTSRALRSMVEAFYREGKEILLLSYTTVSYTHLISPIDNSIMHNVSTLKTTILQIRDVPEEDTVGYSRKGHLTRPSRIAAIPIGYADGLNRHLGNGHAYCLVNGQRAPYVGNICMDVCMIDVTDIDCKEGDSVEIFGDHLPITVLSDVLGTIPYEVLTSVSTRVKRVYYQD